MHPSMLLDVVPFGITHGILIIAIVLLLFCSAFFSAAETAFSYMNTIRIRSMAENKVKGARKALYISEHSDRALTTILVGNNIVNILSTTLCAFILSQLLVDPTLLNVLNTLVMTVIILIVGEILPKSMAKANPNITVTEDELEDIIDTMEEEGVLEKEQADILQGTFKIKEATAHDVMTHRVDVVFLDVNTPNEQIEKLFLEYKYSRWPVYQDNTDNVVGVLNIKDYFNAKIIGKEFKLSDIMTEPLFTAENTIVDTLIKEMQKYKKHLAIVVDEHGGVSGIVSMEDCVETIFGEIFDETDVDEKEPEIVQIGDDEYDIDAEITVEELFDRLQIENLPENPYQTVNSFIFELSEDVPQKGNQYQFKTIDELIDDEGNLTEHRIVMVFTVTEVDARRVVRTRLKINYIDAAPEQKDADE